MKVELGFGVKIGDLDELAEEQIRVLWEGNNIYDKDGFRSCTNVISHPLLVSPQCKI